MPPGLVLRALALVRSVAIREDAAVFAGRVRIIAIALGAALAVLTVAPSARADAAAMSRFYYELGTREYAARRYEGALEQFFSAERLSPSPRTVYNVGLCFLQLRRDEDAYLFLSEYLDGTDDADGAAQRREFAESTLRQLEHRVARVVVQSDPPGARIYVDQREHGVWGVTPRTLALSVGPHTIRVELEGYRIAEAEVTARSGQSADVSLSPERILGSLRVESTVQGHVRVLDAQGHAAAEGETPMQASLVPASYRVEIEAEGHRLVARDVRVVADYGRRLRVEPEPLPPPRASLTVTADVENAVVEIDGSPVGFTPLAASSLSVREHHVIVTAPGRVPWEGDVTTVAGRQTWVRVRLSERPRSRGALVWGLGGAGAAFLVAGAASGVAALRAHSQFASRFGELDQGDLRGLRARGRRLGFTADSLLAAGVVLVGASLLLRFAFGDSGTHASSAEISAELP